MAKTNKSKTGLKKQTKTQYVWAVKKGDQIILNSLRGTKEAAIEAAANFSYVFDGTPVKVKISAYDWKVSGGKRS